MKLIKLISCIGIFFLTHGFSIAQIDSTRLEFFPLHKGDVWQYGYGSDFGIGYYRNQVVSNIDTVMPNGLHYTRVDGSPYEMPTKFFRIDSALRIHEYYNIPYNSSNEHEYNIFRLNEPNGTVYTISYNLTSQFGGAPYLFRYNGIFLLNAFNQTREIMDFQGGYRQNVLDTLFGRHCLLMKGLGVFRVEYGSYLWVQLTGAIIDGKTYGRIVTGIKPEPLTPSSYHLDNNFPNPFNPSTMITFEIPIVGFVSLKIFDMMGREISTLVNEQKEPGRYSVKFDAGKLSSGIYLYKLQAGAYSEIKKMLLMK